MGGRPGGHDPCDEGALMPPADREGMGCDYPYGGGPGVPADPEPCNTGDPRIDDSGVQELFEYLWQQSNADNPYLHERRETAAFLVPNGRGGWSLRPVLPREYGDRDWKSAEFDPPDDLPPGTVYVHTHPISPEEDRVFRDSDGLRIRYDERPSDDDKALLRRLGLSEGLILYGGGLRTFTQDGTITKRYGRCAYIRTYASRSS